MGGEEPYSSGKVLPIKIMIHSLVYRLGYCETISLITVGYYKIIILWLQMLLLMHEYLHICYLLLFSC